MFCSNCGKELPDGAMFCSSCGKAVNSTPPEPNTPTENVTAGPAPKPFNDAVNKVMDNDFVKSVKTDFGNSQLIKMIKEKVSSIGQNKPTNLKKAKIIAIVVAIAVILIAVIANTHRCGECDSVYIGKEYHINFFGYEDSICGDCYENMYTW